MRKSKNSIICLVTVFSMILFMTSYAFADYDTNSTQEYYIAQIDELVDLAGKAARAGNLELAYRYENEIELLGGEVLSALELQQVLTELNGSAVLPSATDISAPPNTNSVHFYKTTITNYQYNNQYFDIITIRAISWDDTSPWLHENGSVTTVTPSVYTAIGNGLIGIAKSGLSSLPGGMSAFITIADVIAAAGEALSDIKKLTIGAGNGTCTYAIDMEVRYQWIKLTNETDYTLRVRESKYSEINYAVSTISQMEHQDGHVDTYTSSFDRQESYSPYAYGAIYRVCQAHINGYLVEYATQPYYVMIGNRTITITPMTIPPYMDLL